MKQIERIRKRVIHVAGDGAASIAMVLKLLKDGHTNIMWHGGRSIREEIEGSSVEGRPYGIAYRTSTRSHLLNAPAVAMSLFPDEESFPHFLLNYGAPDNDVWANMVFAPRLLYRQYLRSLLIKYWKPLRSNVEMRGHLEGSMAAEISKLKEPLILCLGATHRTHNGYKECIQNPWDFDYARVAGANRVMIIGSGLTAVDTALSIWEQDPNVMVHFVSRSGRLPLPHSDAPSKYPATSRTWGTDVTSVRKMFKEFRADVERGISWVALMNDARHLWKHIWRGLPAAEKKRFVRHVRPLFEIHRHRMVEATRERMNEHRYTVSRMKNRKAFEDYDFVFNATGVDTDPTKNWTLRTLINVGIIKDAFDVPDNAVLGLVGDRYCKVGDNIWCVGAYMRPERWEATAMHDIVDMVNIVAEQQTTYGLQRTDDHLIQGPARFG